MTIKVIPYNLETGTQIPTYNPKLGSSYVLGASVTVTNSSAQRVAANSKRKGLVLKAAIANTDVMWFAWDTAAAVASYGLPLEPGETREYWGERCPTAALNGISGSGNQTLYYEEIV